MLGKLIKNEFKSTAHSMFGVFMAAGILFAVMMVVLLFKIKILMTLTTVAMVAIAVAVLIITLFSIVSSFNKSLYGAQGYLSFTLPVTGKQLLAGKTIVSMIWVTISFVFTIVISAFLVVYWVARTSDNVKQIIQSVYDLLQSMQGFPNPKTMIKTLILIVVIMLIRALCMIFRVSFSLAVANTKRFQKFNPIFVGIVVYAILFVFLMIAQVAAMEIPFGIAITTNGIKMAIGAAAFADYNNPPIPILGYCFEIVMSAVLYVATGNIMTNHINIK